jgi:hypothetical protein
MGAPIDLWTIARAKHPGEKLLRVIDLEKDEQRWIVLRPRREDTADFLSDYELDGCTLIYPARADRTEAERAHLIVLYDELYREQLAARRGKQA